MNIDDKDRRAEFRRSLAAYAAYVAACAASAWVWWCDIASDADPSLAWWLAPYRDYPTVGQEAVLVSLALLHDAAILAAVPLGIVGMFVAAAVLGKGER